MIDSICENENYYSLTNSVKVLDGIKLLFNRFGIVCESNERLQINSKYYQ